jgi:DNA-binding NarL/FixJ family response regulator
MIRVLLVDDQDLVRAGLRGILREQFGFEIVGECAGGEEVPAAVESSRPDVVLMDVRMPGLDGVAATRRLLTAADAPPVLALTTFDDDEALAGMLRAGASGFVLKGVPAADLQQAVRIVAEGGAWLDPSVTGRVLTVYREAPPAPTRVDEALATLTARELEVLGLIGRGRTNSEIAGELFVSAGTVKTHVHHIFAKLDLRNRAAAVIFAIEHDLAGPDERG